MTNNLICRYRSLAIRGNKIYLKLETDFPQENVKGLILKRSGMREQERSPKRYLIPLQRAGRRGRNLWKAEISLQGDRFSMVEWKIACLVEQEGREREVECLALDRMLRKKFYLSDKGMKYINEAGEIYFLYLAVNSEVLLIHRQQCIYDTGRYQRRELLAKICYTLTKKYWDKRNIWIFFEKQSRTAQDNGYYFFRYCREHSADRELGAEMYYVLDSHYSGKEDLGKIDPPHLLDFFSFRHMMYLQAAKLLVSSESREQAVVWRNRNSLMRNMLPAKHLFFLQHGVIGLKQLPNFRPQSEGTCDVFIASSSYEKKLVSGRLGYDSDSVAVTGLARYDYLEDKSGAGLQKMILVMPTWREWLDDISPDEFKKSEFYRKYEELLQDGEIRRFLRNNNIRMVFCLHPKAQQYGALFHPDFDLAQVVAYQDVELNRLLMECSLLVTDYSSVSWDAYYMDKPVIFFQFDSRRYLELHGAYLDFSTELFGEQAADIPALNRLFRKYQERQFQIEDKYREQKRRYFDYSDRQNCKRIYERLKEYCRQSSDLGK